MIFNRFDPDEQLKNLVECYWIAEDDDPTPVQQKIIPDGFPEIIFHFRDPYRIKLDKQWELQSNALFAGQITKYFYLENTGASGMLGIKFKPSAPAFLFDLNLTDYTDKVVPLDKVIGNKLDSLATAIRLSTDQPSKIARVEAELKKVIQTPSIESPTEKAIDLIFSTHGLISITEMCDRLCVTERKLQRLFNNQIGLPPKFFARVIRFSYIFQIAQQKKLSWSEVGLESGFYDQPHFIRNFKAFTGEDPSHYFFDQPNLANFFLNKT